MSELSLFSEHTARPIIREVNPRTELIFKLRRTEHVFYNDPGHAWLMVKKAHLTTLGISKKISGYSYQDAENVYLEEDQDAGTYINALFTDALNNKEFAQFRDLYIKDKYIENNIFIRSLKHFNI